MIISLLGGLCPEGFCPVPPLRVCYCLIFQNIHVRDILRVDRRGLLTLFWEGGSRGWVEWTFLNYIINKKNPELCYTTVRL
jgi:hypothetical protein